MTESEGKTITEVAAIVGAVLGVLIVFSTVSSCIGNPMREAKEAAAAKGLLSEGYSHGEVQCLTGKFESGKEKVAYCLEVFPND